MLGAVLVTIKADAIGLIGYPEQYEPITANYYSLL